MSNHNLLIIFVKAPLVGKVKTRLAKKLGESVTLDIYRSMVKDLLQNIKGYSEYKIQLSFWPVNHLTEMQNWLGKSWKFLAQCEGHLGEKMLDAFKNAFEVGSGKVIIIGSDIPTISKQVIHDAFTRMDSYDLVLGPSEDGGYYLIGLKKLHSALFENVSWGSPQVLKETVEIARANKISLSLLEMRNDIDDYDDLLDLWKDLNQATSDFKLPKTFKQIQAYINK
jgi:rSAM/selenodomain-associated transferase 1